EGSIVQEANRVLLERYTPPGVLVDNDLQILQFRGVTGPFLEPAPGDASLSLLKMAREGLLYGLRAAINEARKTEKPVHKDGLRVRYNSHTVDLNVQVLPLQQDNHEQHFLVLFEEKKRAPAEPAKPKSVRQPAPLKERDRGDIRRLEQ